MRDFRKLNVWIQAIDIVAQIYKISEQLPDSKKFGLKSQIQRAAVSVPSNIAERRVETAKLNLKDSLK
jgi:four helix bundle protein